MGKAWHTSQSCSAAYMVIIDEPLDLTPPLLPSLQSGDDSCSLVSKAVKNQGI